MNPVSKRTHPSTTLATLVSDSMVLMHLLKGQRGRNQAHADHGERLEDFYGPQAEHYDDFRERLLHGRRKLIEMLAPPPGSRVVELGGGTGRNLDFFGARMLSLERVEIVDLCPALLRQAQERCEQWPEVAFAIQADATLYQPKHQVDCVYFSYSLSMIPDWRAALANALAMLRPGGLLGVVDFHVSARHGLFTRNFWPRWFAHDGVHLSAEYLPALTECTAALHCEERMGSVPYLPGLRAPYYLYMGRKGMK